MPHTKTKIKTSLALATATLTLFAFPTHAHDIHYNYDLCDLETVICPHESTDQILPPPPSTSPEATQGSLIDVTPKQVQTPQTEEITAYIEAQSLKHSINPLHALAIAWCESRLNPHATNQQGSSATGLFQFINKTWHAYAPADYSRTNYKHATEVFLNLYASHPAWWECHRIAVTNRQAGNPYSETLHP